MDKNNKFFDGKYWGILNSQHFYLKVRKKPLYGLSENFFQVFNFVLSGIRSDSETINYNARWQSNLKIAGKMIKSSINNLFANTNQLIQFRFLIYISCEILAPYWILWSHGSAKTNIRLAKCNYLWLFCKEIVHSIHISNFVFALSPHLTIVRSV